jgi:hypothetical protein
MMMMMTMIIRWWWSFQSWPWPDKPSNYLPSHPHCVHPHSSIVFLFIYMWLDDFSWWNILFGLSGQEWMVYVHVVYGTRWSRTCLRVSRFSPPPLFFSHLVRYNLPPFPFSCAVESTVPNSTFPDFSVHLMRLFRYASGFFCFFLAFFFFLVLFVCNNVTIGSSTLSLDKVFVTAGHSYVRWMQFISV